MQDQKKILLQTPSQTVGPFFAYGLTPEQYGYDFDSWVDHQMVNPLDHPDAITVTGKVFDGVGESIPDAMLEIWQNDGHNRLFGRFGTGTEPGNRFVFHTIKPKPFDGNAPFLSVILFMRGQLLHSYTRIYFSDEAAQNEKDTVLLAVPAERRQTLVAQKRKDLYEFDIYMQGPKETVFFEV